MPLTKDEFDEEKAERLLRSGKRNEAIAYFVECLQKLKDPPRQGDVLWKFAEIERRVRGKL